MTLLSLEREEFMVPMEVAFMSATVRKMIDDGFSGIGVSLHNITSGVLAKIIEYCKKHCPNNMSTDEEELKVWDIEFVNNMENPQLFEVIRAANHMAVEGLMDLTTQEVANRIKDMSVEEVRELFNIKNDYTAEEEAALQSCTTEDVEEPYGESSCLQPYGES
ncbi:SKP1-like protein 14 [Acorus calamus]|uniref:SKP1-like protein n=1 Tax=Acorus calamus TaxID=4465 RepID=A0AAV9DN69_ACOCL|nr:SKP1-like protein 14 [Acorus calamus]